ncbi:hypothetical protein LZ31DRAFT_4846 [Colletotrichum somersetense]|nr:hypothetical protein LZ31DRAFT_4846 [Colletotrichum somersetense]
MALPRDRGRLILLPRPEKQLGAFFKAGSPAPTFLGLKPPSPFEVDRNSPSPLPSKVRILRSPWPLDFHMRPSPGGGHDRGHRFRQMARQPSATGRGAQGTTSAHRDLGLGLGA